MSKHALVPDRARRGLRTVVVVAVAVATVLLGLVPLVLETVEPLQAHFSGAWYPWLLGVGATILAVAGAVQKILTSPLIEGLLQDKAPSLAAAPVSSDGVATITSLSDHDRLYLAQLHDLLAEGEPGRAALERVLAR